MELHERLTQSGTTLSGVDGGGVDPFADLKNRIHLGLVSELGPGLFDVSDTDAIRAIRAGRDQDAAPAGSRALAGRPRTAGFRDRGRRLRLRAARAATAGFDLSRRSWSIGAHEIWIERRGLLSRTSLRFSDESHLRRIITKMVGQVGRRIDESSPMVDAPA
jgi:pilus assembly protein CpaF